MGNVLLIACTNVGRAMIDAIQNSTKLENVNLVGVVNLSYKAAVGKANYDSYVDLIDKYNLNMYYCENVNEQGCIDFMKSCKPDIIIQSGWSQKFKQEVLDIPKYACIGEHPAPLPKGRGAACINWAILTGEKEWGDTFFKMEMTYDTGAIYSQEYFTIEPYDNVKTVYDKVANAAICSIENNLEKWTNGEFKSVIQDDSKSTHYGKRRPLDGLFDFSWDSKRLYDFIRAQTKPYPGAFFMLNINGSQKKVYVWNARITESNLPGGILVTCGDGKKICLIRVQIENEVETWASDSLSYYTIS